MSLAQNVTQTNQTYNNSLSVSTNNLSQQAAKVERDQLLAQYTNQLRQLSVQYEQSKIQNETLALQNVTQLAAAQNDIMSQRFETNNRYLQQMQNILNNQVQVANEGSAVYNALDKRATDTQKEVSNVLSKNAPGANTTRSSNAKSQNIVDKLATELQSEQRIANNEIRNQNINNEYINTSTALLSQMAEAQRSNDRTASNSSTRLAQMSYNANVAGLNKQTGLNRDAYDDAVRQVELTKKEVDRRYLNDLRNLASLSSSSQSSFIGSGSNDSAYDVFNVANKAVLDYLNSGGDPRSLPNNVNRNVSAPPQYYINGKPVTEEEYLR